MVPISVPFFNQFGMFFLIFLGGLLFFLRPVCRTWPGLGQVRLQTTRTSIKGCQHHLPTELASTLGKRHDRVVELFKWAQGFEAPAVP